MRGQFTFYRSFWDAIRRLKKAEDRLSALEAICAYALDGEERPMTDTAEAMFILIRPNLDTAEKRAQAGQTTNKAKSKTEQTENKAETKGEQTPKEKEKEKEKEIEIEKESYIGASASEASANVIDLPLTDGTSYIVTEAQRTEWEGLYPAVDVLQELRKMKGWLLANPSNRKTKNRILRFINGWLAKEQDKGPRAKPQGVTQGATQEEMDRLDKAIKAIRGG